MYIHVDAKVDISPFYERLKENNQVFLIENRIRVYWGGYSAIEATLALLRAALSSNQTYEYFVLLQNLDYPVKSNEYIETFFETKKGLEFLRGCNIAKSKDWHYAQKYKIFHQRDKDVYLKDRKNKIFTLHNLKRVGFSLMTLWSSGVIKEKGEKYLIHYGAAQWGITRGFAEYVIEFERTHKTFNQYMKRVQYPDEEYFHTILHNSPYKKHCVAYGEPVKRWLVNWRNLHYFEFPKSVVVFEEKDFHKLIARGELFIRKVRTGISDELLNRIDEATK